MAITTVPEIVALKSPDFAGDSRLTDFEALARLQLSADVFGDKGTYAIALLVLHWLHLDSLSGGSSTGSGSGFAGTITMEKEGDLARSYSAPTATGSASEAYYGKTIYGQELYQLIRGCLILPMNRCI